MPTLINIAIMADVGAALTLDIIKQTENELLIMTAFAEIVLDEMLDDEFYGRQKMRNVKHLHKIEALEDNEFVIQTDRYTYATWFEDRDVIVGAIPSVLIKPTSTWQQGESSTTFANSFYTKPAADTMRKIEIMWNEADRFDFKYCAQMHFILKFMLREKEDFDRIRGVYGL